MLDDWLKLWRRWMSWWLPGGDAQGNPGSKEAAVPATSDPSASDVDAAATWQPGHGAEPAPASPADDLTAIDGIGPGIARRLDALGIKTFADLAAASPDDLVARLQVRWVTARRARTWIAEAAKRVRS